MMIRERVVQLDVPVPVPPIAQPADDMSWTTMARLLRRLYCMAYRQHKPSSPDYGEAKMPRWDGGVDSSGRQFKPVWPTLADFVLEGQLDPYVLVRCGFAVYRTKFAPPTPVQLQTPAVVLEYRRHKATIVEDLRLYWDRACLALDAERRILLATVPNMTQQIATITALAAAPSVATNATLFRFCAAAIVQCDAICADCHDGALLVYAHQKLDYDAAWGEKIPAGLRTEADEYRRSLSS